MVGIVIVTYNIEIEVFKLQVQCIKRFCKPEFKIHIIDNSNSEEIANAIRNECNKIGLWYIKHNSFQQMCSISHSEAANFAYALFKDDYKYLFFLDHDCIPVKEFNPIEMLNGKYAAGIPQPKDVTYPWPGCLVIDNSKVDKKLVDFSPCISPQLDTGGLLYRIFDNNYTNNCQDLTEEEFQNSKFRKGFYTFYKAIHNGTFIHFANGSNWNNQEDNEERLMVMNNIVKQIINGEH